MQLHVGDGGAEAGVHSGVEHSGVEHRRSGHLQHLLSLMSEQQLNKCAEESDGDELRPLHRLLHLRLLEPGRRSEGDARQRHEAVLRLGAV